MKSFYAKIAELEARLATDYNTYKKQHPKTKKTPSDPMFTKHGDYTISHSQSFESVPEGHNWTVEAKDKKGNSVGHVHVYKDSGLHKRGMISPSDTQVHKNHRRKGLASAMYQHAEKHAGARMISAEEYSGDEENMTDDARALWNQKNRPFGNEKVDKTYEEQLKRLQKMLDKKAIKSPQEKFKEYKKKHPKTKKEPQDFFILNTHMGFSGHRSITPIAIHHDQETLKNHAIDKETKENPRFMKYPFYEEGSKKLPKGYSIEKFENFHKEKHMPHIQALVEKGKKIKPQKS